MEIALAWLFRGVPLSLAAGLYAARLRRSAVGWMLLSLVLCPWSASSSSPRSELKRVAYAEVEAFTPEELTRLLEVTERDDSDAYPFILCLARTGLRLGEGIALQWADVDFVQRVLLVRRSARRGRTSIPKNGKARRVDMSRQLIDVLRGWKTLRDAEAAVEGQDPSPWLFPALAGNPCAQDTFRRRWRRILERADVRYRKLHTLRHTFASLLIQGGEPITYVQRQLGHHSPAFTLAVYTHFVPRGDRRAVDALDDATGRNLYATSTQPRPTRPRPPRSNDA